MRRTKKWHSASAARPVKAESSGPVAAEGPAHTEIVTASGGDASSLTARPAKRRRQAEAGGSAASKPPVVFEHDWDHLSAELRCHLLQFLPVGDLAKMALMSSKWNAAVYTYLRTCTILSFSYGPNGAVSRGLTDAILNNLLACCPRLRLIYGFHLSFRLQPTAEEFRSDPRRSSALVTKHFSRSRLTASGVTRALQQCSQLQGMEISDVLLLQVISDALSQVQLLRGFSNRHGRPSLARQCLLRLAPDLFTTSIELYAVTVPGLPSLLHIRHLSLQYVVLTEQQPFENCFFPSLESFVMKFCTALQLESRPDMLIDEFGVLHVEVQGYKHLFEALANAVWLQSIELIDVHFPRTGAAIWDVVTEFGGFKNLRRFTIGNCPAALTEDIGMLVITSSSRLEELQLQPRGCGEALLLALVATGCEFPALTRLHLGYSDPCHTAVATTRNKREAYDRSGRFLFVNQVNRLRERTTQLTDHCLRRILASPMLPSLSALTICASPHLVDARPWLTPVRTQLTELSLSCCPSLRHSDLEKAIEVLTQLRHLRLERVFQVLPEGCNHVGPTTVQPKQTAITSSPGPFAVKAVRSSDGPPYQQLAAARLPKSAAKPAACSPCATTECQRSICVQVSSGENVCQVASAQENSAQTVGKGEHCSRESQVVAAAKWKGPQGVAETVCHLCLRRGCLQHACSRAGAAGASSDDFPDAVVGCSWHAAGCSVTAAASPVASSRTACSKQRWRRRPQLGPGGDGLGHLGSRNTSSELSDDDGWDSVSDCSDDASLYGSEWSEDTDSCGSMNDHDDGGNDADTGSGAVSTADNKLCDGNGGRQPTENKSAGISNPFHEEDRRLLFTVRSPSLVTLSLECVSVTAVVLEGCSRLDSVTVSDCLSLTAFEFGPPFQNSSKEQPPGRGPLSRISFVNCPKLLSEPVVYWSLVQPLPLPDRLLPSPNTSLRMRVLTFGGDKRVLRVSDLVSFVDECIPQMPDDYDSAFVVMEEHCHWRDTRRRMLVENVLSRLLTPTAETLDNDGVDQLSPLSVTESEHSNPWQRRRRRCGQVKVTAPKVTNVDRGDSTDQNSLVDGPVRVRFVHNLPSCRACGHRIDLWGTKHRHKKRSMCTCQPRPVLASPLRVITCTYLYTGLYVPKELCEPDDPNECSQSHSQLR